MNKLFLITLFFFIAANMFCQDHDSLALDSKKINLNLVNNFLSDSLKSAYRSDFDYKIFDLQVNQFDSSSNFFLPNSSYDIYSNRNIENPNLRLINPNNLCGEPKSFIISGALNFIRQKVDLRVKFK